MGQKTNPVGLRLGIVRGWDSNWYGGKNFADKLIEDEKIRKYVLARIPKAGISKIVIERTIKRVILTINTARPGVVIGKGGGEVDKIKEELKKITDKDVQINIFEIKRPELDGKLVGEAIAQQIESRVSYKRAMKQAIASAMRVGAQGIKIKVSGRLGGAEMARTEGYREGRVPLHTLRADIDYAITEALTVYGKIGVKVWIFKGEVFGKRDLSPNIGMGSVQNPTNEPGQQRSGPNERRGGGDRRRDDGDSPRSNDRRDSKGGGAPNRNSAGPARNNKKR